MKIAVVGCGAMGSIYAALLADAGNEVVAVDRNAAHVDAINKAGLRVNGASGDRVVKIKAFTSVPAMPMDHVIVAVKAAHVPAAAEELRPLLHEGTTVLTIQNGLGSADIVAQIVGRDNLAVGIASSFGASLPEPGHAHHKGMNAIVMGAYAGLSESAVAAMAGTWSAAGFTTKTATDIIAMQWEKLLCNVAFSAPCTLSGLTIGQAIAHPEIGLLCRAATTEAWRIARARGVKITVEDPVAHIVAFAARVADAKPSMLQDYENRRPSEIDVINGAIPKEAAKAGLEAPVNETMVRLVKYKERAFAD